MIQIEGVSSTCLLAKGKFELKNYRMFFNFIIKFQNLFRRAEGAGRTQSANGTHTEPVASHDNPTFESDSNIRNRFSSKMGVKVCVLCFRNTFRVNILVK